METRSLRLPPAQAYGPVVITAVVIVVAALFGYRLWAAAIVTAFVAVAQRQSGVDLEPDRIVLRRSYLRDPIRWSSVTSVDVVRVRGARRVRLTHRSGKDTLPAPYDGWLFHDPAFDERVAAVRAAWERGRGT